MCPAKLPRTLIFDAPKPKQTEQQQTLVTGTRRKQETLTKATNEGVASLPLLWSSFVRSSPLQPYDFGVVNTNPRLSKYLPRHFSIISLLNYQRWIIQSVPLNHLSHLRSTASIMSVTLHTTHGDIKLEVFCEAVPKTAEVCSLVCLINQSSFSGAHQLISCPLRTSSPSAPRPTTMPLPSIDWSPTSWSRRVPLPLLPKLAPRSGMPPLRMRSVHLFVTMPGELLVWPTKAPAPMEVNSLSAWTRHRIWTARTQFLGTY